MSPTSSIRKQAMSIEEETPGQVPVPSKPPAESQEFVAPHPGSKQMPRWNVAELIDAPRFTWRNWLAMIGPGLVMGASAIGGGEWLAGPAVTARYGGSLLWLCSL